MNIFIILDSTAEFFVLCQKFNYHIWGIVPDYRVETIRNTTPQLHNLLTHSRLARWLYFLHRRYFVPSEFGTKSRLRWCESLSMSEVGDTLTSGCWLVPHLLIVNGSSPRILIVPPSVTRLNFEHLRGFWSGPGTVQHGPTTRKSGSSVNPFTLMLRYR